jgi:hypothetical protein
MGPGKAASQAIPKEIAVDPLLHYSPKFLGTKGARKGTPIPAGAYASPPPLPSDDSTVDTSGNDVAVPSLPSRQAGQVKRRTVEVLVREAPGVYVPLRQAWTNLKAARQYDSDAAESQHSAESDDTLAYSICDEADYEGPADPCDACLTEDDAYHAMRRFRRAWRQHRVHACGCYGSPSTC